MKRLTVKKAALVFDRILNVLTIVAGILTVFSVLSVSVDVFMRYVFNKPSSWVMEVNENIILFVTFLISAWVLRKEGHSRLDIFVNRFKPETGALITAITYYISAAICLLITIFATTLSLQYINRHINITTSVIGPPKSIYTGIIGFGYLLLCIQFIRNATGHLARRKGLEAPVPSSGIKAVDEALE